MCVCVCVCVCAPLGTDRPRLPPTSTARSRSTAFFAPEPSCAWASASNAAISALSLCRVSNNSSMVVWGGLSLSNNSTVWGGVSQTNRAPKRQQRPPTTIHPLARTHARTHARVRLRVQGLDRRLLLRPQRPEPRKLRALLFVFFLNF